MSGANLLDWEIEVFMSDGVLIGRHGRFIGSFRTPWLLATGCEHMDGHGTRTGGRLGGRAEGPLAGRANGRAGGRRCTTVKDASVRILC